MKIALLRPGYFDSRKYRYSRLVEYLVFDVFGDFLKQAGHEVFNLGTFKDSGADVNLLPVDYSKLIFDPYHFRSRIQQGITENFPAVKKVLAKLLPDVVVSCYSNGFSPSRSIHLPLAYACAQLGIPLVVYDSDLAFIQEAGLAVDLSQAIAEVYKREAAINPSKVDFSAVDRLSLAVLAPCLFPPAYAIGYAPPNFMVEPKAYLPSDKIWELVFCGSPYDRKTILPYYYDVSETMYSAILYGQFEQSYVDTWSHPYRLKLPIGALEVNLRLAQGVASLHCSEELTNGSLPYRFFETVYSGAILLIDKGYRAGNIIVGDSCIVSSPEEVQEIVTRSAAQLRQLHEQQLSLDYFTKHTNKDLQCAKLLGIIERLTHGS